MSYRLSHNQPDRYTLGHYNQPKNDKNDLEGVFWKTNISYFSKPKGQDTKLLKTNLKIVYKKS